jgi:hypothetical protein
MSEGTPKLLTVQQFAALVGVSRFTVRGWVKTRRINVCLLSPKVLRIEESEVARMVASGLRPRRPQAALVPIGSGSVKSGSNGLALGERERQRLEELQRRAQLTEHDTIEDLTNRN